MQTKVRRQIRLTNPKKFFAPELLLGQKKETVSGQF